MKITIHDNKKIEIELNYGNLSADQFLQKNPDDRIVYFFPITIVTYI